MPQRKRPKPEENATKVFSNKEIEKYIDGIYNGTITEHSLPENIYEGITKYLKDGLYKGYGMKLEQAEGKDLELLSELRENVYMFSAAKTYAMTKEISSQLIGPDDTVRTLSEFQEIGRKTFDNWNDNHGETEYSTAIGQAYAGQQWKDIERTKEILPNLRYSAIGDACEICMPLDGLTAPVDDHVWNSCSPLNHFNCKCILLKEDDEAQLTPDDEKNELLSNSKEKMDPLFESNPGKTGMIFNEHHPYFEEAMQDKEFAKNNFDLPIPPNDGPPIKTDSLSYDDVKKAAESVEKYATDEEKEAVETYTTSAYERINKSLRFGEEYEGWEKKEIDKTIPVLDKFLKTAPKFEGETYRGLDFKSKEEYYGFLKQLQEGELVDKGFGSTTYDKKAIIGNGGFYSGNKFGAEITIIGKNGVAIENLSEYTKNEKEVLFPRGTKFKVEKYASTKENDTQILKVKLIEL